VAIFITGKPVFNIILRILCPVVAQGNIFPVEPGLPGKFRIAFFFDPADTSRLGAGTVHHAKSGIHFV
jgi:hypothetical protein